MTLAVDTTVVVGGFGYVGLALAVEFSKYFCPIGYDFSVAKNETYRWKVDPTGEVSEH